MRGYDLSQTMTKTIRLDSRHELLKLRGPMYHTLWWGQLPDGGIIVVPRMWRKVKVKCYKGLTAKFGQSHVQFIIVTNVQKFHNKFDEN